MRFNLPTLALVLAAAMTGSAVSAQAGTTVTPTTTLSAETGNNTSAADSFQTLSNGDVAAGNVSKVSLHTLLYPGSTSKIYAHFMGWFGGTNHMSVGYRSDDTTQVHKQVTDMISRGIDGAILDWYGPNSGRSEAVAQMLKTESETHPGFEFAMDYDGGALKSCAATTGCDVTAQMISDLNYAYTSYEQSPNYMRYSGRPVVHFFGQEAYAIDWTRVAAGVPGNPMFIFRNSSGFTKADASGGFAWVAPETVTSTDPLALGYLNTFYTTAQKYPSELGLASMYVGFDDHLAAWTKHFFIQRGCGQTWMTTLDQTAKYYSSANQLWAVQLVTWNDYEEGTEFESGVDNCVNVSASMSGTTLNWSFTGQQNTIDHFALFISPDGTNLMPIGDVPVTQSSLDLAPFGFDAGTYSLFVQAVGKPSMTNKMSPAVSFTVAPPAKPPVVSVAATPSNAIAPATVSASVSASSTTGTISSTTIDFGDATTIGQAPVNGTAGTHVYNTPGTYTITATATDNTGLQTIATTMVTIAANKPPQTMLAVTPATGTAPVQVTASTAGSTDTDGTIASSSIDFGDGTVVSGATASHTYSTPGTYTVRGTTTDNLGASTSQTATVTVTAPVVPSVVTITSPANNATVIASAHVVANATSANALSALQVYVDGVKVYQQATNPMDTQLTMATGSHKLTVKAWDVTGKSFMTTITVNVAANKAPVAQLSLTPSTGVLVGASVTASTAGSADSDGSIASTSINFGDGTVVNAASATHSYSAAGTYTVTATVTDNLGATGTKTQTISVTAPAPPPPATPTVTVLSPTNLQTLTGSMHVAATASAPKGVTAMQVYVDSVLKYQVNAATTNTYLTLAKGTHKVTVQAWDTTGLCFKANSLTVTVN